MQIRFGALCIHTGRKVLRFQQRFYTEDKSLINFCVSCRDGAFVSSYQERVGLSMAEILALALVVFYVRLDARWLQYYLQGS